MRAPVGRELPGVDIHLVGGDDDVGDLGVVRALGLGAGGGERQTACEEERNGFHVQYS
jgi:hypothetical protein